MRVTGAEVIPIAAPLGGPVQNARTAWTRREGLLLRLRDEEGRVGQGEASPLPDYSPDTLAGCRAALERFAGQEIKAIAFSRGSSETSTGGDRSIGLVHSRPSSCEMATISVSAARASVLLARF